MSYEMPKGTKLKEHQSWNKQHGYVQTDASRCNREALKAAFEASGVNELRTWVKQQSAKGVAVPSYPTCMAWIKGKKDSAGGESTLTANSRTGLSLEQEFNEKFEADKKAAYVQFLRQKANDLRANLAAVEHEIERLTAEPSVAE